MSPLSKLRRITHKHTCLASMRKWQEITSRVDMLFMTGAQVTLLIQTLDLHARVMDIQVLKAPHLAVRRNKIELEVH